MFVKAIMDGVISTGRALRHKKNGAASLAAFLRSRDRGVQQRGSYYNDRVSNPNTELRGLVIDSSQPTRQPRSAVVVIRRQA